MGFNSGFKGLTKTVKNKGLEEQQTLRCKNGNKRCQIPACRKLAAKPI